MKPNFDIELLPEAIEFLEALDDKIREKIYGLKPIRVVCSINPRLKVGVKKGKVQLDFSPIHKTTLHGATFVS